MELWGGVECTINRVGDVYYDQLQRSGHREHDVDDLRLFYRAGFRTLRVGLLWERSVEPGAWEQWDRMLGEMRRLGMRPIVGLVHHGSGPVGTNLLDPMFPEKLAEFALTVASRYPWVKDYTPVNEPQTTGRFSCLYGIWYPHQKSMRSYVRSLEVQIKAVVLAMRAIRTVQPEARLIHTEDGGATFSTPELEAYRVQREHRRWLGMDLLCGRVTRQHALYAFLLEEGLSEREVLWFAENPCPPAVVGLNYYVTSDRFLDHRVELYPWAAGGDTGEEPLVDVEAVRVYRGQISGMGAMLRAAWSRYGLPVAVTEAHLGCRDVRQQVRWLVEGWREACQASADGVQVEAVTAWALLGSHDWCRLCTQEAAPEEYEPGVFDVSGDGVRKRTALTDACERLVRGEAVETDGQTGWWERDDRFTVPAA